MPIAGRFGFLPAGMPQMGIMHLSFTVIEEGDTMAVVIDQDACISCGACADACPVEVIDASDKATLTNEDECLECGACVSACPVEAITL